MKVIVVMKRVAFGEVTPFTNKRTGLFVHWPAPA